MAAQDILLLQNATATGSAVAWPGGPGIMLVVGTFSGASVALQVLGPDGSTYIAGGPVATAAGAYPFNLPACTIKGVITGGPPTGIYARVASTAGGMAVAATGTTGGADSSGRQVVVGAAASGAAVAGNPVLSGGSDGTNAVSMAVDASGRQIMVGAAANDAPVAGGPVRIGARARTSSITAVSSDDQVDAVATRLGAIITRLNSIPEAEWTSKVSLTDGTSTALQALAASNRQYLTAIQIMGVAATTAVTISILDGASAIWTGNIIAGGAVPLLITFPTPLRTTAGTALNVQLSGSPTGAVAVCAQGYTAP